MAQVSNSSLKTVPSPDLHLEIPAECITAHSLSTSHTFGGSSPRMTANAHSNCGTADDEVDSALAI